MDLNIDRELEALHRMTTSELCDRYAELHGQSVRTRHRQYLIRKIAWRIQALAEGDLSERARKRAAELANDADIRVMPPRPGPRPRKEGHSSSTYAPGGQRVATVANVGDARLPAPGTAIVRNYKGRQLRVVVLPDGGLDFEGERYKSLSAVAKKITGSHLNGYRFFRLDQQGAER